MGTFKGHVLLPGNTRDEAIPEEDCMCLGTGSSWNRALTSSSQFQQHQNYRQRNESSSFRQDMKRNDITHACRKLSNNKCVV